LYINYESRDGRHFGQVNSTPCLPVGRPASGLPYYETAQFTPRWAAVAHQVGAFNLTRQTGASITERSLNGRIHVASFIYTRCAAVCPILVGQLGRVQRAIQAMPDVTLVSYTVTPDTDTPGALAAFGRDRGIDPSRWWLVTGNRDQIYRLARDSYFADDSRVGRAPDRAQEFLHTEKVLLVDRQRRIRGVYNGTQPFDIDQLIADIGRLRAAEN
jgi:protein SCO1/2